MDNRTMFYGATPEIFERAKLLRENLTETEKMIWQELRGNKILGLRFKSQHPMDTYIVDFYCHQIKLVIEIDGGVHKEKNQKEYDAERTFELENCGLEVIRFTNEQVQSELKEIIQKIQNQCKKRKKQLQNENISNSLPRP